MTAPDYQLIAEVMLFSEGFSQASWLAGKVVHLYKLASQQLSQQVGLCGSVACSVLLHYARSAVTVAQQNPYQFMLRCVVCNAAVQGHYDFGMRALKAVLMMAGGLKRSCKLESEVVVVIRALRDANIPKLLTEVRA